MSTQNNWVFHCSANPGFCSAARDRGIRSMLEPISRNFLSVVVVSYTLLLYKATTGLPYEIAFLKIILM